MKIAIHDVSHNLVPRVFHLLPPKNYSNWVGR